MSAEIRHLSAQRAIEVRVAGRLGLKDHERIVEDALRASLVHRCTRVLVDNRRLEPGLAATDIYEIPRIYERFFVDPAMRIALLILADERSREGHGFFETVSRSRGFDVSVFEDRDSALEWLTR